VTVANALLTYEQIGKKLLAIASTILRQPILPVSLPAHIRADQPGRYADQIHAALQNQDDGAGAVVLTDSHAATPDNRARHFSAECDARIVSGVNLPMWLCVLHYRRQPLQHLCETANSGDRSGIQLCEQRPGNL
jgi:mannose/fructose-specific phosphotransferase system component IIA